MIIANEGLFHSCFPHPGAPVALSCKLLLPVKLEMRDCGAAEVEDDAEGQRQRVTIASRAKNDQYH